MYGIPSLLIPLALVGTLAYLVMRAARSRGRTPASSTSGAGARRLFGYAMVFAALVVAAVGVTGLLSRVLTAADARSDSGLASTIALTVVGVPVCAALARWTWRRLLDDPSERGALGWTLYLNGALITSLAVAAGSLAGLLAGLVDGTGYQAELLAATIVWGAVWVAHWTARHVVPPAIGADLHVLVGSGIGLGMLAVGAGAALADLIRVGFDASREVAVGRVGAGEIVASLAVAAVGGAVWTWHWPTRGARLDRDALWLAYVLLFGVLGGLAATLTGCARSLFLVLEWLFGEPETTSAIDHYRLLSPALAAAAVGFGVWRYHGSVVGPRRDRPRTDVDRIYDTIVAGASLAMIAGSLVILVVALFRLAAPAAATLGDDGGDVLIAALTLLVTGTPVWVHIWRRMQHFARRDDAEITSTPRRTYLLSVLGLSGAVAFGALIGFLIVVFEAWLGERTGGLNEPLQWPVALLVTTGTVAWYHFVVLRAERAVRIAARPRRDVLLVWGGADGATEIAARTHSEVRVLHRTDVVAGPAGAGHLDPVVVGNAIDAAEGDHLLVLAGPEGILVVPYE